LAELLTELETLPELELTGFDARTLTTLRLEPATGNEAEPEDSDRVEITLVTDPETYLKLAPDLDALVGQFDLVTHIRHGNAE
jgi:hypothetical protein